MENQISVDLNDNTAVITLGKTFNFRVQHDFSNAYGGSVNGSNIDQFVIDFKNTEYLDSTALGMLLVFRQKVGSDKGIKLSNCNAVVNGILEVANFGELFEID